MQIQHRRHLRPGARPAPPQAIAKPHQRRDFGIQRLGDVVAVVVVRIAIFALIAFFHPILVHERHG
ncbi:MAG: hypothetical protein BWZ10_03498 [candidate division BRC1 bacterium ADurb.BinA364]|nr:MAG: hypothetical protein BWZ10_03498 [candidate division BRC1 bacterium ADurb.BinA364]